MLILRIVGCPNVGAAGVDAIAAHAAQLRRLYVDATLAEVTREKIAESCEVIVDQMDTDTAPLDATADADILKGKLIAQTSEAPAEVETIDVEVRGQDGPTELKVGGGCCTLQ